MAKYPKYKFSVINTADTAAIAVEISKNPPTVKEIKVISSLVIKVETTYFLLSSSPGPDVENMRLQLNEMYDQYYITIDPIDQRARESVFNEEIIEKIGPSRFANDNVKICFVGSLLIGNALTWYRNAKAEHEQTRNIVFENIDLFFETLREVFDDPNYVSNARDLVSRMRQGRDSCLNYTTKFRNVALETGYNEIAK
ncbi:hypothetical protein BB560_005531, partial [Smittium megazygosporum]